MKPVTEAIHKRNQEEKFIEWCHERHQRVMAEAWSDAYSFDQWMKDIRNHVLREAVAAKPRNRGLTGKAFHDAIRQGINIGYDEYEEALNNLINAE